MKLNAHKIAILEAIDNNTLDSLIETKAAELFRLSSIGQCGYKNGWSLEQHVEFLKNEAVELTKERAAEQAPKAKSSYNSRRTEKYIANGFYGTARDHARGFDGIE